MSAVEETGLKVEEDRLARLKRDLEGYRELILPVNRILEWEQKYHPAVLIGCITFVFALIWYLEPSVLTTFSLLGLLLCVVDFTVPTLSAYLFSGTEWTVIEERQYERLCIRILNARTHIHNTRVWLLNLKNHKPKAYLLVMMGIFATLAWIGSLIDNLLLTYLLVVFVAMLPGLRRRGIIQKVTDEIGATVKKIMSGNKEKSKTS